MNLFNFHVKEITPQNYKLSVILQHMQFSFLFPWYMSGNGYRPLLSCVIPVGSSCLLRAFYVPSMCLAYEPHILGKQFRHLPVTTSFFLLVLAYLVYELTQGKSPFL